MNPQSPPADGAQRFSRVLFDESFGDPGYQSLSDPGNARRVAALTEICPTARSHLDVGCGHGDILRALRHKVQRSTGCDTSQQGLRHARAHPTPAPSQVVQAAADHLPFVDRAFDLVSCCDVLEHLPEQVMWHTLREMMRVSSRWILINVPLDEDLGWSQIRCTSCGHIYHREHHQRSFTRERVLQILPAVEFAVERSCTTGWTVRRPVRLPAGVGAGLHLGHDPTVRCERCGEHPAALSRSQRLLRDSFVLLHNGLTKPLRRALTRDTEIAVLFRRRG